MLVQHGKPPSPSGFSSSYRMLGGPRLLGLSELGSKAVTETGNSDFCSCAAGPGSPER